MNNKIFDTEMKIDYNNVDGFNRYPSDLQTEYIQSIEEGLDIDFGSESKTLLYAGEGNSKTVSR